MATLANLPFDWDSCYPLPFDWQGSLTCDDSDVNDKALDWNPSLLLPQSVSPGDDCGWELTSNEVNGNALCNPFEVGDVGAESIAEYLPLEQSELFSCEIPTRFVISSCVKTCCAARTDTEKVHQNRNTVPC